MNAGASAPIENNMSEYNSQLLENAVTELSRLPGIGKKTALRLALYILRTDKEWGVALGEAIIRMRQGVTYCKKCHNISEKELCDICADSNRQTDIICVVENVRDIMSIENTRAFKGLYHVLGGLISPIDGIGPQQLEIQSLVDRVEAGGISEVILALSPTMEGETTGFYIYRKLEDTDVHITQLARGLAVGNDLEYADEITLGRSIDGRQPFINSISNH